MHKAYFTLDSINETEGRTVPFAGYTTGEYWNGWATPYFTRDEAMRLVAALNVVNESYGPVSLIGKFAWYDADTDAFVTVYENDIKEVDTWEAVNVVIDGDVMTLYPIGAWAWCWNLCESGKPDAIVALRKCEDSWQVADPWIIVGENFVASASDDPSHHYGVWGMTEVSWVHGAKLNTDMGVEVTWADLPITLQKFLINYFGEDN